MLLGQYIVQIFIALFILYLVYKNRESRIAALDSALIESLERLAAELEQGRSMETALLAVSQDRSNKASRYFGSILDEIRKGATMESALESLGKKTRSRTFAYICDVMATAERSKGNVAPSLKELARKLWEIEHLEAMIDAKTSTPILILQTLGIFLLPAIYFFLASILPASAALTLVGSPLIGTYLLVVCVCMAFLEWFIFRDLREALIVLPVALSFYYISITLIGPYIINLMTGAP